MKHLLIGLTGPAGCGKNSVADALRSLDNFVDLAFADALRAEVCAAFNVPLRYLTDRDTKELPLQALALGKCYDLGFVHTMAERGHADEREARSPRQIMQWWGTEYRRAQQTDYWIKRGMQRAQSHLARKRQHVTITDVRFGDEAAAVRAMGGQIWQITRPGTTVPRGAHASETTGAEFFPDLTIDNSGDLHDLHAAVQAALEQAKAGVAA